MPGTLTADGPLALGGGGRRGRRPLAPASRKARRAGVVASALAHLVLVALLIALPVGRALRPVTVEPVAVDIVASSRLAARVPSEPLAQAAPDAPEPVPAPPEPADAAPTAPQPPVMVEATRMMARALLERPDNRQAREALAGLVEEEQLLQLCALEGMEQIAAWDDAYAPEQLEPEAMADARLDGSTVAADGAAVFSRGAWFNVSFACELSADLRDVVSFAFRVGDPVPRSEWEAHYLTPRRADADH